MAVSTLAALPAACSSNQSVSASSGSSGTVGPSSSGQAGAGAQGTSGSAGVASGSGGTSGQPDASVQGSAGSGGGEVTDAPAGGSAEGSDSNVASDAAGPTDGSEGAGNTWTGTWAAAPQSCGGGSNGQTQREIVHTSIAGTSARVRISNAFGGGPLQVSDVHLAQVTTGSSIDPTTDKTLMFNGQPNVTIAAGMFAVSDGADFVVKALSDVAVSFFVVSSSGGTCQPNAFQTNYSVAGNMVTSATLGGTQTNSYMYLSNLDVLNPNAEGAVVTLGASITCGFQQGAPGTNRRWPNDLAVRLVNGNRVVGVLNEGISGDGVKNAVSRFDRDVLSQPNIKWVIFSDNPINDLGGANPPTAQAEIDQIQTMMASAHAKGVKFLCSTLTPYLPAEPGRTTINTFIRSPGSGCDGIVDQDTATHDPSAPMQWLPAFNSGDSLHPNVAGLQAIADSVDLTLFK
jgi:lysophospholipase L1-like esterase